MIVCYDPRTGAGCDAQNPDGTPRCRSCGMGLAHAVRLYNGGDRVGSYRIIQVLGHGGVGAVYAAEALPGAGRPGGVRPGQRVALKENFDPASLTQLQREFAALSRVDHPNLPGYYEVFAAGGNSYLVMELVPGQNLQDVLDKRSGGLVESQVLGYAMQLCDALTCLHSQTPHILHRDIKPANIRLTPEGLIKLVDFGLLKQGTQLTVSSIRGAGTPAYAPIEQYGTGGTDARSDLYSLGATLYSLLTGQVPLPAIDRMTAPADPLPTPQRLNARLSPGVSTAVLRALAVRREDRFATAQQFKDALLGAAPPVAMPAAGGYAAPPTAPASGETNILAIISLIAGILGLLTLCGLLFGWLAAIFGIVPVILGIVAALLGFVARNQIKQRGHGGSGLAMAGVILGYLAVVVGLTELAGLAALIASNSSVVNQLRTSVPLTLTAGATPGP